MCLPKAPSMPSPEEQAKQQLEVQRQLQADADSKAAKQLEDERKKARLEQQRSRRGARGRASLISQRQTGLFGISEEGYAQPTIAPTGVGFGSLSNQ